MHPRQPAPSEGRREEGRSRAVGIRVELEVTDLDHQRGGAVVAAFAVRFAAADERKLASSEGDAVTVIACNPAHPIEKKEELAEAGLVGADDATGLELDHVDVGDSVAGREACALGQTVSYC